MSEPCNVMRKEFNHVDNHHILALKWWVIMIA